ncbi:MAG TPA: hypothetical protein VK249_26720 [Anaerolineales bacterium]|nr:hypothetical protein [Anaerolineales bacterium]
MLSTSDLLHLPYTRDLTEGGIACALHALPYLYSRSGGSAYDRLRRVAASAAVELAFRRYLSEQGVPFEVKGATPFTEHERYDVLLDGRRCELTSFLISHRDQISQMRHNPQVVLGAPALVASDQHARDGHSQLDLYLFAFLPGLVTASQSDLQKAIETKRPYYLIHLMPEIWNRPVRWDPLGRLVLKSEAEESVVIEIGGQAEGRDMRSYIVELPPRTRIEMQNGFFSLSYVHIKSGSLPGARIGIHSPARQATHLINIFDWGNLWVYGMEVLLAGYLTRQEFGRRASFIQTGSRVFQYDQTHVKNLAVPVSDLKPLSELFERVKEWSA